MQYKFINNTAIIRIDRGEKVIESLTKVANELNIKCASVNGIGATDHFRCGIFDFKDKSYKELNFQGCYEILSLSGNMSIKNGEPYCHIHITTSDEKGNCYGGHLIEADISVTCEIFLNITDTVLERKYDKLTTLNILDI